MPKPSLPDLFASKLEVLRPEKDRVEPRVWVRRMMLWKKRGELLRDIPLRPGLNIIWSPDAVKDGQRMGHGGGKTSFCRLLRYCLGEDSFGTADQRQLLAQAMPEAHVGAEVMVNGELWIVIRPIGNSRTSHFAQKGGSLAKTFQGELPNSTISPLRQAIARAVMPDAAPHMPGGSSPDDAWKAALAWMTRDQECRLLNILEWRAPETQSRSPSRHMPEAERLDAVRLLINALQPAEIEAARLAREHQRAAVDAARRKERVEWVRDDVARGLAETFGGDPGDAGVPDFWMESAKAAAQAELAKADPEIDVRLKALRAGVTEKDTEVRAAENRLSRIDGELTGLAGELKMVTDLLPKLDLRLHDATNPKCQTCGKPLDSHSRQFIAEQQAVRDEYDKQQTELAQRQRDLKAEEGSLRFQINASRQELERRQTSLAALETKERETSDRVASANGYVTLTSRFRSYEAEIARLAKAAQQHLEEEARARRSAQDYRRASQNVVDRLSELFDAVIRFLIPEGAQGRVTLAEDGIHPQVTMNGNLTTAAVDSLKVVAFDLAALLLTVEGKTQLPGFWLHDSPREADLGLALYHRLFELARQLETSTATPLFQYIITTTTMPPTALKKAPWKVLELSSSPPTKRLFRENL